MQGLATAVEEQTSCCYAVQDKVWVDGPGGEPWEIYTVLADAEMPAGQLRSAAPGEAACCATRPDLAGTSRGRPARAAEHRRRIATGEATDERRRVRTPARAERAPDAPVIARLVVPRPVPAGVDRPGDGESASASVGRSRV